MNAALYKRLKRVTPEEQAILDGNKNIQWETYYTCSSKGGPVVDSDKFMESDTQIAARKHTRFAYFPDHKHNYVEIFYVYSGSVTHVINDKELTVHAGEILFMNQHMQHAILPCGENDLAINIIVMPTFFEQMSGMVGSDNILAEFLINVLQKDEGGIGQYLYFPVAENPCIQNIIDNIVHAILYRQINSEPILINLMDLLFLYLISDSEQMLSSQYEEPENLLMLAVRSYISNEYQKGTLKELAERTRYSVSSLSRLIKKYTGQTFKEMQAEQRMKVAMELLSTTDLPISEIAMSVGYENQSFFYKRFQEEFQATPSEMRHRLRMG